jgi:hypothetical protein
VTRRIPKLSARHHPRPDAPTQASLTLNLLDLRRDTSWDHNERVVCAAGRCLARTSHSRWPRLLLQPPDEGYAMDQAGGSYDSSRGMYGWRGAPGAFHVC